MRVIGDKNQIYEDVFDFIISYLPFPQKSIRSELAKPFSISIFLYLFILLDNAMYLTHCKVLIQCIKDKRLEGRMQIPCTLG